MTNYSYFKKDCGGGFIENLKGKEAFYKLIRDEEVLQTTERSHTMLTKIW